MSVISLLCIVAQIIKPGSFTGASCIMYLIGGNRLDIPEVMGAAKTISGIVTAIFGVGFLFFSLAVFRGNIKGRLEVAYFIMTLYSVLIAIIVVVARNLTIFNTDGFENSLTTFFVSVLLSLILMAVFSLREHGSVGFVPYLSSALLLVVIGQLVSNGLFVENVTNIKGVICGGMAAFPFFTIFVFEKFVVESSIRKH